MTTSELKYLIALNKLSSDGGVKQAEIARDMKVSKVSVCKAVEKLQAKGLLECKEKRIFLSSAGRTELDKYMIIVGFVAGHLELRCGTSKEIAYSDALGVACVLSDASRKGISDFLVLERENEQLQR